MKPHQRPQRCPSANRIRERYLHQLGLQRGIANSVNNNNNSLLPPLNDDSQHRVVVIGLPSLPEERDIPAASCALESRDYSAYSHNNNWGEGGSVASEEASSKRSREFNDDDSNSFKKSRQNVNTAATNNGTNNGGAVDITSMALKYPTAVLKNPFKNNGNNNNTAISWGDHDSVGSSATSTTAGSSFTNTLVSKDWGNTNSSRNNAAMVHHPNNAVVSMEDSSTLLHGVHYNHQNNHPTTTLFHPTLNNNNIACPATSSLTHAMNRFNIDSQSDCDTTSHCSMDDTDESLGSPSFGYANTTATTITGIARRRKAGKAQRLMDRAAAQTRSRSGSWGRAQTRSRSGSWGSGSCRSLPQPAALLHHVRHGGDQQGMTTASSGDLSRTPVASNCRALTGVHISSLSKNNNNGPSMNQSDPVFNSASEDAPRPLGFHPLLASNVPQGPAETSAKQGCDPRENDYVDIEMEEGIKATEPRWNHRRQSSIDDVLEVAEALAKLSKGRTSGSMIPRIR